MEQAITTPSLYVTPPPPPPPPVTPQYGGEPVRIEQPEQSRVSGEEGSYVTLKCVATGHPAPVVTWRKDTTLVSPPKLFDRRDVTERGSIIGYDVYFTI